MRKKEKFTFEAAMHTTIHLLGVLLLFWLVLVPPLWVALLGLGIEIAQMKLLGNCVLTKIAHKRGVMTGMSFWEYVPYMLGVEDYIKAKVVIDYSLKLSLGLIFLVRLLGMVM